MVSLIALDINFRVAENFQPLNRRVHEVPTSKTEVTQRSQCSSLFKH